MVGTPLATELAAADATGVDEAAREEAATDEGARLLAGAIEDAALDVGVGPPPPPPPPQAVINPLRVNVRSSLDLDINRSY